MPEAFPISKALLGSDRSLHLALFQLGDGAQLSENNLPENIIALDASKIIDRRVLATAALNAFKRERNNELRGRSLLEELLLRLTPSKGSANRESFKEIKGANRVILISFEAGAIGKLNNTEVFQGPAFELETSLLDAQGLEKQRVARELYTITDEEVATQCDLWKIVCSRIATKDV
mmetsp:Transcript_8781/g.15437  ORF Transcript_8781/g.15437 Transcript_8781/m.15437 type:complete len:177 (+) Transcript_8781:127-657(+)